jgi:hypothetical protein
VSVRLVPRSLVGVYETACHTYSVYIIFAFSIHDNPRSLEHSMNEMWHFLTEIDSSISKCRFSNSSHDILYNARVSFLPIPLYDEAILKYFLEHLADGWRAASK